MLFHPDMPVPANLSLAPDSGTGSKIERPFPLTRRNLGKAMFAGFIGSMLPGCNEMKTLRREIRQEKYFGPEIVDRGGGGEGGGGK